MQELLREKRILPCLKSIFSWYESETIILLDCVLTDDIEKPEYSAITCWKNIENLLEAKEKYFGESPMSVEAYLLSGNYTAQDIKSFVFRKQSEENCHRTMKHFSDFGTGDGSLSQGDG